MRICAAQIKPSNGSIQTNIEIHKDWINLAISGKADFIAFPELSLTGYEPKLAKNLAIDKNNPGLDQFQMISERHDVSIALGAPTRSEFGILISMVVFQPYQDRTVYSKQMLPTDELPYFAKGKEQLILTVENEKIAPAICYESLQNEHSENVMKLGTDIYLASVAKSQSGIEKAFMHYSRIAHKYSIPVVMANSIGFSHNSLGAGQSACWNEKGKLLGKLANDKEGLLIYDTETKTVTIDEKDTANN